MDGTIKESGSGSTTTGKADEMRGAFARSIWLGVARHLLKTDVRWSFNEATAAVIAPHPSARSFARLCLQRLGRVWFESAHFR